MASFILESESMNHMSMFIFINMDNTVIIGTVVIINVVYMHTCV